MSVAYLLCPPNKQNEVGYFCIAQRQALKSDTGTEKFGSNFYLGTFDPFQILYLIDLVSKTPP